ncbi:MAG TPA: Uma2 family endonuclease [Terriglobia bacterium]|jgi:Uma2 family endonuclease
MNRDSQRRYSLDEYFSVEESSPIRNEYYDGQIFAMAGASLRHNGIAANVLSFVRPAILGQGCQTFGSGLRVQTPGGLYTYPDLSVVCGEPLIIAGRPDTLTNPILLAEVLSDATREYDRNQKFTLYREIPTLREYILVEQDAPLVEVFRRSGKNWQPQIYDDLDAAAPLESIRLTIPLRDVYQAVFG